MHSARPLPPALINGVFSTRTARDHGVSPSRLRSPDLVHPFHGVNAVGALHGVRELCQAYLTRGMVDQWFSHVTAAALMGVALPASAVGAAVHVSVAHPRTPPRGRGVIGHSVKRVQGVIRDGLPMCAPSQVWSQLAGLVPREELVAAGDHLVGARRRGALASLAELSAACRELRGRRGAADRDWALSRIRVGADSRPESLLRLAVARAGYANILVNEPVSVRSRSLTLHPDLLLPDERVALEYEGDGHRVDRDQWHQDIRRHDLLEEAGWNVVRVTSSDLFGSEPALHARIASAARRFVR